MNKKLGQKVAGSNLGASNDFSQQNLSLKSTFHHNLYVGTISTHLRDVQLGCEFGLHVRDVTRAQSMHNHILISVGKHKKRADTRSAVL